MECYILQLPDELLLAILQLVDFESRRIAIPRLSKRFHRLCHDRKFKDYSHNWPISQLPVPSLLSTSAPHLSFLELTPPFVLTDVLQAWTDRSVVMTSLEEIHFDYRNVKLVSKNVKELWPQVIPNLKRISILKRLRQGRYLTLLVMSFPGVHVIADVTIKVVSVKQLIVGLDDLNEENFETRIRCKVAIQISENDGPLDADLHDYLVRRGFFEQLILDLSTFLCIGRELIVEDHNIVLSDIVKKLRQHGLLQHPTLQKLIASSILTFNEAKSYIAKCICQCLLNLEPVPSFDLYDEVQLHAGHYPTALPPLAVDA